MSTPIARLGAFDLLAPLGEGGMGAVYRAVHAREGVEVAVKVVSNTYLREPRAVAAFRREVRAVASLTHGNIISVLDHDVIPTNLVSSDDRLVPGSPYLVMELGQATLRERLPRQNWESVREILLSLLDALAHAHAHGIIHRDLKPPNILWVNDRQSHGSRVKLSDFGLVYALSTDLEYGRAAGTPAYMAPEQFRAASRDYGPWTDLYAVGIIAYWMVAGRRPFEERDELILAHRHLHDPPPPLLPRFVVPEGLETWILRLLEKNPRSRYRLAADAAYGLEQLKLSNRASSPTSSIALGFTPSIVSETSSVNPLVQKTSRSSRTGSTFDEAAGARDRVARVGPDPFDLYVPIDEIIESESMLAPDEQPPPPLPSSWARKAEVFPRHLLGAGLGLFGLRAIPLVGRIAERDRLWHALSTVGARRRPEAIVISGPAGIGKTALAEWFERRAHEVGAAHTISAVHERGARGRRTLVELVRSHLGVRGLDWAGTSQRVRQYMSVQRVLDDRERRSLTDLVAPSGASDLRGQRLVPVVTEHAVIARVLERASRDRPLIVRLEDAQWSAETLAFVERTLDESTQPVLFVLTIKDEALNDEPLAAARIANLVRRLDTTHLALGPLPTTDHRTLVGGLLHLGSDLAEGVVARTAGNPLFAREVVRAWVERGMLHLTDEGFVLENGVTADVPDDLHALFRAHITRVVPAESHELHALEIAAICGIRVDPAEWRLAADLAGISPPRGFLERMMQSRVLTHADPRGLDNALRFAHGLLRESLERSAREAGRLSLWHQAIAETLKPRFETGELEVAERLAHHQRGASLVEDSLEPLRAAASLYTARAEYERALGVLDAHLAACRGLTGLRREIEETENRIAQAEVRTSTGEFEQADALLIRALEDAERLGNRALVARAAGLLGHVASLRGDRARAEPYLSDALQRFDYLGLQNDAARCLRGLAEIAAAEGRLDVAFQAYLAALEHCRAGSDELGVSASLVGMGLCDPRDPAGNRVPVLEALEICERQGLYFGVVASLNALGELARRAGCHSEAESRFRRAIELSSNLGAGHLHSTAATSLALVLFEAGRDREARDHLANSIPAIEELGHGPLALLSHSIAIRVNARASNKRALRHHLWAARTWIENSILGDGETVALLESTEKHALLDVLDAADIDRLALDARGASGAMARSARSFFVRG